jgi:amino-acid N-acetyltransferase
MKRIERAPERLGIKRLFVLTTRTEHWFVERGFKLGSVDDLPARKRDMYNYQRRSKVLFKTL